jgi:hypothetical protein
LLLLLLLDGDDVHPCEAQLLWENISFSSEVEGTQQHLKLRDGVQYRWSRGVRLRTQSRYPISIAQTDAKSVDMQP